MKARSLKCFLLIVSMKDFWNSRTRSLSDNAIIWVDLNNVFQPLTIITKCSILDVAAVLFPPVQSLEQWKKPLRNGQSFSILIETPNKNTKMAIFVTLLSALRHPFEWLLLHLSNKQNYVQCCLYVWLGTCFCLFDKNEQLSKKGIKRV